MMSDTKKVKDKEVVLFNPIYGKLDLALKFNSDRIVTADTNMYDTQNCVIDPITGQAVPTGPLIVTDEMGNVILADDVANITLNDLGEY